MDTGGIVDCTLILMSMEGNSTNSRFGLTMMDVAMNRDC